MYLKSFISNLVYKVIKMIDKDKADDIAMIKLQYTYQRLPRLFNRL